MLLGQTALLSCLQVHTADQYQPTMCSPSGHVCCSPTQVYAPWGLWNALFDGNSRPFPRQGLPLKVRVTGE
jgi:hypothetical protein